MDKSYGDIQSHRAGPGLEISIFVILLQYKCTLSSEIPVLPKSSSVLQIVPASSVTEEIQNQTPLFCIPATVQSFSRVGKCNHCPNIGLFGTPLS